MTRAARFWRGFLPHRGDDGQGPPVSEPVWRATVVGLHAAFLVMLALAAVVAATTTERGVLRVPALLDLTVLAVAYAVAGAHAIARPAPGRAVVYLVVLVLTVGVLARTCPPALFLLFLAYQQVWFLVEHPRAGIRWTLLLAGADVIGNVLAVRSVGSSEVSGLTDSAVGLLFSLVMGLWVSRVLRQSRERAALIVELESTRTELAASHHQQGVMSERERPAPSWWPSGWGSSRRWPATTSARPARSPPPSARWSSTGPPCAMRSAGSGSASSARPACRYGSI